MTRSEAQRNYWFGPDTDKAEGPPEPPHQILCACPDCQPTLHETDCDCDWCTLEPSDRNIVSFHDDF